MNHHFTPSFDSIRQPALEVSWSSIIDEFNFRFHSIYDHTTSKIHLDLDNYAIDGSTSTWRDIVLLDCILCIFLKRKVNAKGGSRRLFNQYVAIRESVCVVCSQAWVRQLSQPLNTNTNRFSSIIESIDVSFPSQVVLTEISQVWSSMDNLRAEFLHTTPKKSARKRHDIANHYFNLDVFRTKSLKHIALDVVNFIFREHFHHALFCTDDYTSKLLSLSFSTTNSSSFTGTSSIQVTNNKTKNTSEHGHVTSSKPPPDYSNSNGKKFIEKCDFILEYAVENILPTIAGATKS